MATEGFKRKLTAILSADAVGYSRLMGEDEAATVRTLETYKRVISDLIQQHRGRVVDAPGTTSSPNSPAWWMRCNVPWRCRRRSRPVTWSYPRPGECSSASGLTWGM